MTNYKRSPALKFFAYFISFLLFFNLGLFAEAQTENPFIKKFDSAKEKFFAEDYESAKGLLENLVSEVAELEGNDTLKGESYLLLGATYEHLDYKQPAIKYYCKAKAILGKGKSIKGLILKDLKWYKKGCKSGVVSKIGKKRKGGILGLILGVAILGGIIWYLFINENSPLKKSSEITWSELVNTYHFETYWNLDIHSTWSGSVGTINVIPPSDWGPWPQESNNWDDTKTVKFSKSGGGSLVSVSIKLEIWLKGCNNGVRKDTIDINDINKMQRTTTFTNDCSAAAIDSAKIYKKLHTQASLADIKIRHKLDLSGNLNANNIKVRVRSTLVNE